MLNQSMAIESAQSKGKVSIALSLESDKSNPNITQPFDLLKSQVS